MSARAGFGGGGGIITIEDVETGERATYTISIFGVGIGGSFQAYKDRYIDVDIPSVRDFQGRSWELNFVPLFYRQGYNTRLGEINTFTGVGGVDVGVEMSANFVYFNEIDYFDPNVAKKDKRKKK